MDVRPLYTTGFAAGEQRAGRLCVTWQNWYQGKRWLAYSVLRLDAVFKVELEYRDDPQQQIYKAKQIFYRNLAAS